VAHVDDPKPVGTPVEAFPSPLSQRPNVPPEYFVKSGSAIAARVEVEGDGGCEVEQAAFVRAGPRGSIAFDAPNSRAAIVTCGGLCPGVNNVIREIVLALHRQYGFAKGKVLGVAGGYRGFLEPSDWIVLDPAAVAHLQKEGGSLLGTSRGGHDTVAIVDSLVAQKIDVLFCIGGDGTVRGAEKIANEVSARGLKIAVALVPKTIDNDVPIIDRTFGFDTAVEQARKAIEVAHCEAVGFPNGLGVVKLMGRHSGFIAMHATLGTGDVDLCLVPEVPFAMEGKDGVLAYLEKRLEEQVSTLLL